MRFRSKSLFPLFLVTLVVSSLSLVNPTNAQTIPAPSVPQFTVSLSQTCAYLSLFANSKFSKYDNYTIEVAIENQPYAYSNNGITYQLYYNIRYKLHTEDNWTEIFAPRSLMSNNVTFTYSDYAVDSSTGESASQYTSFSFCFYYPIFGPAEQTFQPFPPNSQLDFQVESLVGHNSTCYLPRLSPIYPAGGGEYFPAIALDATSNWSSTQTITIPANSVSANPTPNIPELSYLTILPLLLSLFSVAVVLRHRITANVEQ